MAATTARPVPGGLPWGLWGRQLRAVLRLELRRSFLGRRGIPLLLLAFAPLLIPLIRLISPEAVKDPAQIAQATQFFAVIYQAFILRIVIFLGCVAVFGNLLRREILDRSLHYAFLTPTRRELLVVAKYLMGVIVTAGLFSLSAVLAFALSYLPHQGVAQFLWRGPGLGHLGSYLLVTVLSCIGYGAIFLVFGFLFKSPAVPALAVFGWEAIHFLLPPMLKQLSVIHYVQSLCPVPLSAGPLSILADAPSPWIAIPGLLLLASVLVAISAWKIRGMEVTYEEE